VKELNGDDLNCGVFNYLPLVMVLTIELGVLVGVTSLLIRYRLEVLVFLYTRFNIRPFDMYRYNMDRPYVFDAFVSFSQHDHQWVAEELVAHLENQKNPYKLCIHLRDFPAGAPIAESVAWAVTNARCTILVLTKHFLGSEWCRHEMRTAYARLLKALGQADCHRTRPLGRPHAGPRTLGLPAHPHLPAQRRQVVLGQAGLRSAQPHRPQAALHRAWSSTRHF
jgi:hypothetical protein